MTTCDICLAQGFVHKASESVSGAHVCAYHQKEWLDAVDRLWKVWRAKVINLDVIALPQFLPPVLPDCYKAARLATMEGIS